MGTAVTKTDPTQHRTMQHGPIGCSADGRTDG